MALQQCIHLKGNGNQETVKNFSSALNEQQAVWTLVPWKLIYATYCK